MQWFAFPVIISGFMLGLLWPGASMAQDRTVKVQAVFLFKFMNYITWPEAVEETRICVIGAHPFQDILEQLAAAQKRPVTVAYYTAPPAGDDCHMAYFTEATVPPRTWQTTPTLTMSALPAFAGKGGMIELKQHPARVEILVNRTRLEKTGLKASARLLELATVVEE